MKPFWLKNPKGVMTCEEIRYWIRELMKTWPYGCLARTLGLPDLMAMKSKLRRSWIYYGEQIRFSAQIDRILRGELVPVKTGLRWDAMVVDDPVPLKQPARMQYDLQAGRLKWVPPRRGVEPVLSSFAVGVKSFVSDP
jgi:hypothetical protein